MADQDKAAFSHAVERDLRLDLFRGMGLWMIFLDHIPHDIVAWLTLRNYGFSDAAEFFVFISGYLAGFIYGPIVRGGHFLAATKRLVMRAWQMYVAHIMLFLLFIFAAWCGVGGAARLQFLIRSRVVLALAVAWMLFALLIVMTWHVPLLESLVPKWMIKAIYPIDKTDLDMLRLTHFLALAVVVTRYLPRNWAPLTSKWLRPLILCGQHSLPIFCIGVFLSFGAHWILMQYTRGVWEQLVVSADGIVLLVVLACF